MLWSTDADDAKMLLDIPFPMNYVIIAGILNFKFLIKLVLKRAGCVAENLKIKSVLLMCQIPTLIIKMTSNRWQSNNS